MALDRRAGGHAFGFDREVCVKCGMTREHFEDNGKPACKGRPKETDKPRRPIPIEDQ